MIAMIVRGIYRLSYFFIWGISLITLVTLASSGMRMMTRFAPAIGGASKLMIVILVLSASVMLAFWITERIVKYKQK